MFGKKSVRLQKRNNNTLEKTIISAIEHAKDKN